jgi:hypothetical protein
MVELIQFVYHQADSSILTGTKCYPIRKQATFSADLVGVDLQQIYELATWASSCSFSCHYQLDMMAQVCLA